MGIVGELKQGATWRIGLKLLVAIVGIELLIMLALAGFGLDAGSWWIGAGDALALGLCSSALIYVWVVRPLALARAQNDLFRVVVDHLPAGVVVTEFRDGEPVIAAVNPAFTRITGYREDEVVGRHPRLLQGDDASDIALAQTRRAMREKRPVRVLQRNRRKDGRAFWNDLHLAPIVDDRGRVTRWVGLVHDVTERKELEDEVRRLAHAVEQTEEAICTFDLEGNIEFSNPAFRRNVGLEEEGCEGRRVWDFWEDDEARREARQAVRQGRAWSGRHRRRRAGGDAYEAMTSLSPVRDESGRVVRYSAMHRDMTDVAEMEMELMRAQRMEAVGTLAGGIAHDFNNMLAGMLGHLYLMKEDVRDRPRVLDRIRIIEEQGHRAAEMIRQLLTFARKSDVDKKPFDMRPFAKELVRFVEPAVPENIRLTFDVANEPMPVEGDAALIQQCILNLIANARHAIEERMETESGAFEGVINLVVRPNQPADCTRDCLRLRAGACPVRECVEVRVEDNGCGMDEATRARIFEPYFTTKAASRGTGLGLPMVLGCVEMHQGCIRVSSAPGEGSVFSLFFPCAAASGTMEAADEAADEILTVGHGELVLVADDNEPMRNVLCEMLKRAGYRVTMAEDGDGALQAFQRHADEVRMVFIDKVMPGRDGLEVARHVGMARPDVCVVVMTGYDPADELANDPMVECGAIRLLRKPWQVREINRLLREMMNDGAKRTDGGRA